MSMRTEYVSFRDAFHSSIPGCEVGEGKRVTIVSLIENDDVEWIQLNRIYLAVSKRNSSGVYAYYGKFEWEGAVAVKPDVLYGAVSDPAYLFEGDYKIFDFGFVVGPRIDGLYYKTGSFDLKFVK